MAHAAVIRYSGQVDAYHGIYHICHHSRPPRMIARHACLIPKKLATPGIFLYSFLRVCAWGGFVEKRWSVVASGLAFLKK